MVDENVVIGEGTKVWYFSHIQSGARIGKNCLFGQNVNISNNVKIGDGVKIQNNASIYEDVELEDYVFYGSSCVFTNDLTPRARYPKEYARYKKTVIHHDATIAADVVLTKNVAPHALMADIPAKRIGWVCDCGQVIDDELICSNCRRRFMLKANKIVCGGIPSDSVLGIRLSSERRTV